ncbi:MAG: hemolysin III family protein [Atopobiaceae bacterium]|jgi:hemolysin III|nr:hemolysin III family protein [Atopobiaceae bacterium]MCH4181511.1 hemolysin III family protein [Atopobiaceae bacterium]MCH4214072.1 hemolysin III family protein [Atopobiaceae bacterium]MCH4229535.1 hemolysin III family protein [Atopobiaceae bacterium]MCH4276424.1 hemolysin III family protein [Atopobiaceae bacterium]
MNDGNPRSTNLTPLADAAGASSATPARLYTVGEEIANSVSHGVGALLAIAALVLLIVRAVADGGGILLAAAIVFGGSLLLEYLFSTLYHAIQPPAAKRVFRILDHSAIYLLIAGTYTPFCLVTLADAGGVQLAVAVWVIAAAGIVAETFLRERQPKWLSAAIYLGMGWLVVIELPAFLVLLPGTALALLVAGGLCYTVGTAFYVAKRVRYMHFVWHLFVLAGSVCHFLAVLLFVI